MDELTQFFASLWDLEGLNGLEFPWYGHNTVTSDVITQAFKFVGSEVLFSGFGLDPILMEAGGHLFEDSKMFCPRAFCDIQKVININTYGVSTDEDFRHLFLEDFRTVSQTHRELLILSLAPLGEYGAQLFRLSTYFNVVLSHI